MVGKKTTVTVGVGSGISEDTIPRRHRRSLEIAGSYDVPIDTLPVDNTTVIRPDIIDREVSNLIISSSTNPNYRLFTYVNKKKADRYKDTFDKYLRNKK